MNNVYFLGDLHLGHRNILKYSTFRMRFLNLDEMHTDLIRRINSKVNKNDTLFLLGDIAFKKAYLPLLNEINGNKRLILGNHDVLGIKEYLPYFSRIFGCIEYRNFFITHVPIHSSEFEYRVAGNIHGHLHNYSLEDYRYINVNVDQVMGFPVSFNEVQERLNANRLAYYV